MPLHVHFIRRPILTHKVGQTDLVLAYNRGSLVGLCTENYKSLYATIMIASTLLNMQRHTAVLADYGAK